MRKGKQRSEAGVRVKLYLPALLPGLHLVHPPSASPNRPLRFELKSIPHTGHVRHSPFWVESRRRALVAY